MVGLCKYVYTVVETVDTVFRTLVVEHRDPYSKLPINAGRKRDLEKPAMLYLGFCSLAVVDRILTSPSSG